MLTTYLLVLGFLDRRLDRDERGDALQYLIIGAVGITLAVFLIPGLKDLASSILENIKTKVGGMS